MASIAERITKPGRPRPLKALFFGPPGSGKTSLGGTAPKPLILDFEDGTMTLRGRDVDVFQPRKWSDVQDAYMTLALGSDNGGYQSVVLDTVSMMQEIASWDTPLLSDFVAGKDPRNSYGRISAAMKDMLWKFALLPINCIFLAQIRIEDNADDKPARPEEGRFTLIPDASPAIAKVLTSAPDVIGRTFVRATPKAPLYGVNFGPDSRSIVKHRNLGLPTEVSNLTIPKLLDKIGEPHE